ncbi:GIY-YIG nuclease family protein [Sphingobacterium lumbrici]|uniref:GIY-YIG nuclease family protein n=1 Tax=Sphingobacterium lumbrici TaxID=2559600 RepID=UPI00112D09C5|nr:GIY-YIG nuclease family protein [Sphingobacterium lumbrici]
MNYFVYAIKSEKDGRIYVGLSANPYKRLDEHNSGKTKSTKGFIPWTLIYIEEVDSRIEAREKEKYYKSGFGKEYLKALDLTHGPVVQRIPACRQAGNRCLYH